MYVVVEYRGSTSQLRIIVQLPLNNERRFQEHWKNYTNGLYMTILKIKYSVLYVKKQ